MTVFWNVSHQKLKNFKSYPYVKESALWYMNYIFMEARCHHKNLINRRLLKNHCVNVLGWTSVDETQALALRNK